MVQSIFTDADEYDLLHRDVVEDIPFFINLAEEVGGPVLELGCGTGRIALPIARRGMEVVGMDLSYSMVGKAMQERFDTIPLTEMDGAKPRQNHLM